MTSFRRFGLVAAALIFTVGLGCASHQKTAARVVSSDPVADAALVQQLDQALARGQTDPAHYGARVIDLKTGRELYAVDPDSPLMPASNGKLAIGSATLDFFGSKAVFKTYLAIDGDDLWLIGTGDPGIGDSLIAKKSGGTTMTVLDEWADALKEKGVTSIKGNLYYYDGAFDDMLIHPSWSKDFAGDWYAAPISGLNFNNNCIDITLTPTSEGQPVKYTFIPPVKNVQIINKCVTGTGETPDASREQEKNVFTIKGATTHPTTMKSKAITNPGSFFANALRTHLEERGIKIAGKTVRADKPLGGQLEPPKDKTVATHETSLPDALSRVNKQSQNNFAEGLCKILGRAYRQKQGSDEPGSWAAGTEAARAFLQRNGIDTTNVVIVDGSGLSRNNRVTPRMITDLFKVMWNHPEHETFFDSLSISGDDGTIRNRLKDLRGRVHAKTGYIGGVRSLSGYVKNDDGNYLAFSFIFNGFSGSEKPYEDMQDNAVRVLAHWPKLIQLPPPAKIAPTTWRSRSTTQPTQPAIAGGD